MGNKEALLYAMWFPFFLLIQPCHHILVTKLILQILTLELNQYIFTLRFVFIYISFTFIKHSSSKKQREGQMYFPKMFTGNHRHCFIYKYPTSVSKIWQSNLNWKYNPRQYAVSPIYGDMVVKVLMTQGASLWE